MANKRTTIPLSPIQQSIWLSQMKKPDSPHLNIGFSAYLEGELDIDSLKNAIQIVCNENDALRLVIKQGSSIPEQILLEECDVSVSIFDTSSSEKPIHAAEGLMQESINIPFEFNGGLLWSISLIRIGHHKHCMFTCFHHIINDGFGCGVFFKKVCEAYNLIRHNTKRSKVISSFVNEIEKDLINHGSNKVAKNNQYWMDKFINNLPEPILPPTKSYTCKEQFPGGVFEHDLSEKTKRKIESYSLLNNSSVLHFMISIISCYFCRIGAADNIVIGVAVHNRSNRIKRV